MNTDKMKILEVITLESSAENFISDQPKYLKEQGGYEVHLICSPNPKLEQYAASQGMQYKAIQIERQVSIVKDVKAYIAIRRYMKANRFNVLIAHSYPKACLLSMTAGAVSRIPHRIEIAHGALQEGLSGFMKRFVIMSETWNSTLAHKVVTVSDSVSKRRQLDKIDDPKKQLLLANGTSNGVDSQNKFNPSLIDESEILSLRERYGFSESDFVIGFCGRLVRDKGVTELVKGFKLVKERYPDKSLKLLVIGQPEQRDALPQETLSFLKESNDIVFTGRIPYEEIQKYYLLMDLFILPSYREGFPTVVLEASAMERPVVTTRKTGCVDSIIDGETGLYINIEPESIAEAVEKLFDTQYARQLGKNGRKWVVENFDHVIVREAMFNLIKNISKE